VPVGDRRLSYLPLPSIEARGDRRGRVVGSVRRVAIVAPEDCEEEIAWARRALPGRELVDEETGEVMAVLSLIPLSDRVVGRYLGSSASWATVTPVVLPGYDDPAHYRRRLERGTRADEQRHLLERLDERIDGLIRKAIVQGGYSQVLADHAEIEWRKSGFWPGSDLADRYGVPDHLRRFPRLHVCLHWRDAQRRPVSIAGPVCLGGGRFYGIGLLAALEESRSGESSRRTSWRLLREWASCRRRGRGPRRAPGPRDNRSLGRGHGGSASGPPGSTGTPLSNFTPSTNSSRVSASVTVARVGAVSPAAVTDGGSPSEWARGGADAVSAGGRHPASA
jgi:hypothetical protein